MNEQTFLQVQVLELRRLLDGVGDDPILRPQLQERLEEAERDLAAQSRIPGSLLPKEPTNPSRAAIFLRGEDIDIASGISASLAGDLLIQYEKMFVQQALHDEREAAKRAGRQRRRRGTPFPGLLLTGTPQGSFGLEFVARRTEDGSLPDIHSQSLHHVADALMRVAESTGETLEKTIQTIPSPMLRPLQKFLTELAKHDVGLRLAFPDRKSQSLSIEQLKRTSELLAKGITQDEVSIPGVFRGVARESGWFDLKTQTGSVITGIVADDLTEDDLERIDTLLNLNCVATMEKTTVRTVAGPSTPTYVLLDAKPIGDAPGRLPQGTDADDGLLEGAVGS